MRGVSTATKAGWLDPQNGRDASDAVRLSDSRREELGTNEKGHDMPLHRHTMTLNVGGSVRANDPTSQSIFKIYRPSLLGLLKWFERNRTDYLAQPLIRPSQFSGQPSYLAQLPDVGGTVACMYIGPSFCGPPCRQPFLLTESCEAFLAFK